MLELKLPLEWAEPSDRIELLAGELDELAPLSPWRRRGKKKQRDQLSQSDSTLTSSDRASKPGTKRS